MVNVKSLIINCVGVGWAFGLTFNYVFKGIADLIFVDPFQGFVDLFFAIIFAGLGVWYFVMARKSYYAVKCSYNGGRRYPILFDYEQYYKDTKSNELKMPDANSWGNG